MVEDAITGFTHSSTSLNKLFVLKATHHVSTKSI